MLSTTLLHDPQIGGIGAVTDPATMADPQQQFDGEQALSEDSIHVSLTYAPLDSSAALARVKSPKAGAVVLFAGTYHNNPHVSFVSH